MPRPPLNERLQDMAAFTITGKRLPLMGQGPVYMSPYNYQYAGQMMDEVRRSGCLDFLSMPSRVGDMLYYRNGYQEHISERAKRTLESAGS